MADTDISPVETYTEAVLTPTQLNAELSNVYTNHVSKSTAQTITAVKTFTGSYTVPIIIGTVRLWHDATNGCLRVKYGSNPSSETDGTILMEG